MSEDIYIDKVSGIHLIFHLVNIFLIMSVLHLVSYVFINKCRGFVQQLFSSVLLQVIYKI